MITGKRKFRELSDETKEKISTSTMGRPKKLHRLEVHLNSQEASDYFRGIGEVQDLSLIADTAYWMRCFTTICQRLSGSSERGIRCHGQTF